MDLAHNDPDAHIVRGIVDLVHGLGKRVVAEGVETADGLAFLLGVGCDVGQGLLLEPTLALRPTSRCGWTVPADAAFPANSSLRARDRTWGAPLDRVKANTVGAPIAPVAGTL